MSERDIVAEIEMAGRLGYSLQISEAEARRVTDLLQEREALVAVVAAAREVFSEFENVDTSVKQMLRLNDLRRALAALDGGDE